MEKYCSVCNCLHESPKWYNSKTITDGLICKKSYLKEYHEKNKEKVNEQRRNQYKEDIEHRERVKEVNRKNRIEKGYKKKHKPYSEFTEEEKQKAKEGKDRYKQSHPDRITESNKKHHAKHYIENIEEYKIKNKENRKIPEYQYWQIRSNAKRRNIELDLTLDTYKSKRKLPCHYCGKQLEETGSCIDRLDNSIRVYNDTNTVPCCHICNYLKGSVLSEGETLSAIIALKKYFINGVLPTKLKYALYSSVTSICDNLKSSYTHFKANLKVRDIESSLSFEGFVALFKNPDCFYCGGESTGLDRLANSIGYSIDNCVPCCMVCNRIKGDIFDYDETFAMINAIQKSRIFYGLDITPKCTICGTFDSVKWVKHPDEDSYLCNDHYRDVFKEKNDFYDKQIDFISISSKFYERLDIRREKKNKYISK